MRLQLLPPLLLLLLLPVIVVLYKMKQKAKQQQVSSLYLWREAYENLRSDTPWEKLRHNLLMYLQLLAMALLIFAMTSPILTRSQKTYQYPILVLDRSASMGMAIDTEERREDGNVVTRLDVAKEEAIRYVNGLESEAKITVVAVDDAGTICISASQNHTAVKNAIRNLTATELAGDVSAGGELYRSFASLYEDYHIIAWTDTPVDFGELSGDWVDVASEVTNVSVDMISSRGTDIMVKVSNHSQMEDYHGDLSLFLEEELLEVRTIDVERNASEVFYFKLGTIPEEYEKQWEDGLIVMASLSGWDALAADNVASHLLQKESSGKVLLVTKQNVFLEQALRADENLTVYRAQVDEGASEDMLSGYDLYVFDGILPEKLPQDGAVFLLGISLKEETEEEETEEEETAIASSGGYLTFQETEATSYLSGFQTGFQQWMTYELPEWGEEYLKDSKGNTVGYYGKNPDGQMIAVLGVDLHQGDFSLHSQFPIFISQMCEMLLDRRESDREIQNFPVQESGIMPSSRKVVSAQGGGIHASLDELTIGLTVGEAAKESGYPLRNGLLAAVLVLLAGITVLFFLRFRREKRKIIATIPLLRIVTAVLVILAMAGLTYSGKSQGVTTVYLLDVSDSCEGAKDAGEEFIRQALANASASSTLSTRKSGRERAAVVAFGGDARIEQFVSEENLFQSVETNPIHTATNLERAVQTGLALISEEDAGRLVLITDGGETDGDITNLVRGVTERQVETCVVYLDGQQSPESYISQMDVPANVEVGENFLITVEVESNCHTNALITLFEGSSTGGERQKAVREVELSPGTNQFVFADTRTEAGLITYRAVLESSRDTRSVNNQYTAFTNAKAASRLLLLEKEQGESASLQQVLTSCGVQLDVRLAGDAPSELMDLCAYSAVILLDIPVAALRQGFLDNLKGYVQDYGGGLITVGGGSSYALGGYRDTVLEEILPVDMDLENDTEVPALSMIYVIDKSGSMGGGSGVAGSNSGSRDVVEKLEVAKSAAAEAAKNLRDIDRVGVIAFDDAYEWVLPMTDAGEQKTISSAIGSILSGGGTSIYPALKAAVEELEKENTRLKHIILLTDGQDSYNYYQSLTTRMQESGITLSAVAVGEDADTSLLTRLAHQGQGRYYFAGNLSELPEIFAQEVVLSMGEYLVNREFMPVVTNGGGLLSGVWEDGLYPLLGYVASTPKAMSTIYLESDSGDPILSSMQYGLGRTVAWQADAAGGWNVCYEGTREYQTLWHNLVSWIQTELTDETGIFSVERDGNTSRFAYETEDYTAETSVQAVYTDRDGNRMEVTLEPAAPGVYEAEVELEENQSYSVFVTKQENGKFVSGQMSGVAMQYSREYRFADSSGLEEFLASTGGKEIREPSEVYETSLESTQSRNLAARSLVPFLLGLAVAAFFADIVIGRFDLHPAQWIFERLSAFLLATRSRIKGQQRRKDSQQEEENRQMDSQKESGSNKETSRSSGKKKEKQVLEAAVLDTSALLKKKQERKRS